MKMEKMNGTKPTNNRGIFLGTTGCRLPAPRALPGAEFFCLSRALKRFFFLFLLTTGYGLLATVFSPAFAQDTDSDGMPDSHENTYGCLMANTADASVDYDTDGMSSLEEYQYSASLNPCNSDTDGDGMPDGWEVTNTCLTPLGLYLTLAGTCDTSGHAVGIHASEEYLYVADSAAGLQVINAENPANPTIVGTYDTPSYAHDIYVSGNYAYVADLDYGLQVINVSNPANPTLTGIWDDNVAMVASVYVSENYAYLAETSSGLRIINVSNPANPTLVGSYNTPGSANGVYTFGNFTYVADSAAGLQVINVENPANPTLAGTYDTPSTAEDIYVSGNYAYVADYTSGLQIINVSNPANPTWVGTYNTPQYAYGVYVSGGFAYVADDTSGLKIINVSNPASPLLAATYNTPGYAMGVYASGSYAYVADGASGIQVLNLSDADADGLLDQQEYGAGTNPCNSDSDGDGLTDFEEIGLGTNPNNSDTDGDGLGDGWEVNYGCLHPLSGDSSSADGDVDGLSNLEEFNAGTNPCSSDPDGDGLTDGEEVNTYFTDPNLADTDGDGLMDGEEVNTYSTDPNLADTDGDGLTDGEEVNIYPTDPNLADTDGDGMADGWEVISGSTCGIDPLFGDSALDNDMDGVSNLEEFNLGTMPCIADTDGDGLGDLWEITNTCLNPRGLDPTLAGTYNTPGWAYGVFISGNFAYVSDFNAALQIINVSSLTNPTLAGACNTPLAAWDVVVSGNYAYVADADSGLRVINVSNPANPTLTGTYNTPDMALGVYVSGNYAYVADGASGLKVITIANPANPTLAGTYDTLGSARDVYVSGGYAYVADSSSGLQVINVSNPANPTLAATYDTPGSAIGVFVSGGYAYVADSSSGLLVINVSNPTNPTLAATYDTPGSAIGVFVSGGYTYVADSSSGLQVINVSNPTSPTLAGTYNTMDTACGVYVSGSYAYVADNFSGLQIIAVSDDDLDSLSDFEEYNSSTDPCDPDTDMDGLSDGAEVHNYLTNPLLADSESDGMDDGWEVIAGSSCGLDPLAGDTALDNDLDGLSNLREYGIGTMPCVVDTDGDGMDDGWEVLSGSSCGITPLSGDSAADNDLDGLSNLEEFNAGADPCSPDPDADGLTDLEEIALGTNPNDPDTDGDGMDDGWEDLSGSICGINPLSGDSATDNDLDGLSNLGEYYAGTNPCIADTDGDGLTDGEEVNTYLTNPSLADTDGDGFEDGDEVNIYSTNPNLADTDGDGLEDDEEVNTYLTDPNVADTDGDDMDDGWEAAYPCMDPLSLFSTLSLAANLSAGAGGVFVSGSYAYVASEGLMVIDVSDPVNPTLVATYNTPGSAKDVYVSGNYAYVADYSSGLQIIDVSDPENPSWTGAYDTPDWAMDVYVSGNYAYMADYSSGLQVIDVSIPSNPTLAGSKDTPGYAHAVYVSGNYAYVADSSSGLQIINVSNPALPSMSYTYDTPSFAFDVYVSGNYAYVADLFSGLQIIDVSLPTFATLAGTYDTPGSANGVYTFGNFTFVADGPFGLQVINVENPANPILAGSYDTPGSGCGVYVSGEYAYVADNFSLQIIALSNSDADGLSNMEEYNAGTDPCNSDPDGDGLTDIEEIGLGTNPNDSDTDDDGLDDGAEVNTYPTSPFLADTDDDGLLDGAEVNTYLTNPLLTDTESDGMDDGWEVLYGLSCGLDPLDDDTGEDNDMDGLSNLEEYNLATMPCLVDTDADGMPDGWEVQFDLNPTFDDSAEDPDNDGLTNLQEYQQGKNPRSTAGNPSSSCSASLLYTNSAISLDFENDDPYAIVHLFTIFDGQTEDTGVNESATAGTFIYSPCHGDGWYRFYTIAKISEQTREDSPTTPDAIVGLDTILPISFLQVTSYSVGAQFPVAWYAYDTFSGIESVVLYYRKGSSGSFSPTGLVGDTATGVFLFDPTTHGGDGRYEFFAIATDPAGNQEPMKQFTNTFTIVDSTPATGFTVADGVDLVDDQYWTSTSQLSASWTSAADAESGIGRYEYAIGTSAGGTDIKTWTNNFTSTAMTATGLSLMHGMTVFTTVRAYNGAGLVTQHSSNGVIMDTMPPVVAGSDPEDGEHVGTALPVLRVELTDDGAGIERGSLGVMVDFVPVAASDYEVCFGSSVWVGATVMGGATCGDTLTVTHAGNTVLDEASHVLTVSLADALGNSMSQSIVFFVDDPTVLRINPAVAELWPGETVTFAVSGGKGGNEWSATGGGPAYHAGDSFVYTAGAAPGIYTVSVSDISGASKSAPVTIHGALEIDPPLANLAPGERQTFAAVGGTPPFTWSATGGTLDGSTDAETAYTAGTQTGAFSVSILDADSNTFAARVNVTEFVGRAIIVAGGGPQDSQWDKNEAMAKRAFSALVHRGFTGDKIYFLNNDYQEYWDGDFDGVNDVRGALPTEGALEDAFTWAAGEVSANIPLTIYLIDHGGDMAFQLTGDKTAAPEVDDRILSADELKTMLDGLQLATGCRVTVVLEACHSGSFLNALANPAYSRKLLMSSRGDELSFLSPEPIFSLYFWSAIQNGFDLREGFNEAWQALLTSQWKGHQHPQADGDGSGSMGPIGTEQLSGIFIGTDVGTLGSFPEIADWDREIILASISAESGATVHAIVHSVEPVAEVYALIVPPGFTAPSPADAGTTDADIVDTPVKDLVKVSFQNTAGSEWAGRYDEFIFDGVYTLVLYARDARGQLSLPVETLVTAPRPYIEDAYPAPGSWGQAQNVQMRFHLRDAEDGVDESTIRVVIDGGTYAGMDVTSGCSITGDPYDYLIAWTPSPEFGALDEITVTVFADDYYGNAMTHRVSGDTLAPGEEINFLVTDGLDGSTDGMPDDWEDYFEVDDPAGDPDLDGASNLTEFEQGTDPRDPDSTPNTADLYENDDLLSWASAIAAGGTEQAHNFHDAGDVDWVRFLGVTGLSYQIEIYDVGPNADPTIEVYGTTLGLISRGGVGEGETVTLVGIASVGDVFVKVRDLDRGGYGSGYTYKIRIVIPGNPLGTMVGQVTNASSGDAISNAAVLVYWGATVSASLSTDTNGWYVKLGLSPGNYTVMSSKTGFSKETLSGVVVNDGRVTAQDLRMLPIGTAAEISGYVRDQETGTPIAGANVQTLDAGVKYDGSDDNGYYQIKTLTTGSHAFTVIHPQYNYLENVAIDLPAPGSYTHDFSLLSGDSDGDGLSDTFEDSDGLCTSKTDPDSDDDGLCDGGQSVAPTCVAGEVLDADTAFGPGESNPCLADSDADSMPDDWEKLHAACVNPLAGDSALDPDTDADTNLDEYLAATDPCVSESLDTDGDGLTDLAEGGTYGTDPDNADTDGDGLTDGSEITSLTNPLNPDADGDGLADGAEVTATTDPLDPDTDNDGVSDGAETSEGTDPKDPGSFLPGRSGLVSYQGRLTDDAGVAVSDTVAMTFALFDGATGGAAGWSESHDVDVNNGIYTVALGGDTSIPSSLLSLPDLYLEITAASQTLSPRQHLTSALTASNADRLAGQRLESGQRLLSIPMPAADQTLRVSFDRPFTSPPKVVVSDLDGPIGAEQFVSVRIYNITAAGFDVRWLSLSGTPSSGTAHFGYQAWGE